MPNFDGGHYFFTALIPVRTDPCQDPRSTESITSHTHALREVLASLPTALQTPVTEKIGVNSPFARCGRTHFARLAVLDDVAFNGRAQQDPILARLRALVRRPYPAKDAVDSMPCPYLIVVADFDARDGEPETLEAWARDLFGVMEPEWRAILQHCHGYERVTVLDLSGAALAAAQVRLGARASCVKWVEANIIVAELPAGEFDVWHDRAVFHFLTTEMERHAYVQAVLRAVKPGGFVIVATFAEDGPTKCSGLPVMRYGANELHAEFGESFLFLGHEKETHHTPGGNEQKFVYCFCRKIVS